jgi:hypothetical protein
MRKTFIYGGSFLLLIPLCLLIFWKVRQAHYEPKIRDAKHFCEALIPKIEASKQRSERYSNAIDPSWIEVKQVPELIRLNDFYEPHDDMFVLYFRYPGDF